MKRRKFLLAGGAWLTSHLCAGLARLTPSGPIQTLVPTLTLVRISTATPAKTLTAIVEAERAVKTTAPEAVATAQSAQEASPTPRAPAATEPAATKPAAGLPIADDFADPAGPPTRTIGADSAGQIRFSEDSLRIVGVAPGRNDPCIVDSRPVPFREGQAVGVRFQTAWGHETGWMGLATADGQLLAGVRRTALESEGGWIAYGGQTFPVLNLYSNCWYDFVVFQQAGEAAFAINDGAGLELVLMAGENGPTTAGSGAPAYLGYRAEGGEDQGASIAVWYATELPAFPPVLLEQAEAAADFEADLGTNAAWVEARIQRASGSAGLRVRSLDRQNEYRVTLDGTSLKVEQVIEGTVTLIARRPVTYRAGAKLAVRYNELTLTVYYDGALTEIVNRKIGAPELLAGSKVGIYSTAPGSIFRRLVARLVCFELPEDLRGRLLQSRQVLCLGDSLTTADKAFGYQNRLRKRLGDGWVTVDCGVSSQTTYQMVTRLPVHLRRYTPEVLIVLGGTNDIDLNRRAGTIQANLQAIYSRAKQAGMQVVAITIPPRGNSKDWTAEKQAVLETVNAWIRGAANVACVDAYALLKDPDSDCLQSRYDGGDHVHLGGGGYNALADAIYASLAW